MGHKRRKVENHCFKGHLPGTESIWTSAICGSGRAITLARFWGPNRTWLPRASETWRVVKLLLVRASSAALICRLESGRIFKWSYERDIAMSTKKANHETSNRFKQASLKGFLLAPTNTLWDVSMGVCRNFFQGGQRQPFAYPFQMTDNTMQIDVCETLYPFYTIKLPYVTVLRQH